VKIKLSEINFAGGVRKMIDPIKVEEIFTDVQLRPGESALKDGARLNGELFLPRMHKGRLESHREEVRAMLCDLPDKFLRPGKGDLFIYACQDRSGKIWGDFDQVFWLLSVGIALEMVTFSFPKWRTQNPRNWRVSIHPGSRPIPADQVTSAG
jgi:hypothetical protein